MIFFDEIEAYLTGELSPTDRQIFEVEMARNPDLQRAVAEQNQLLAWIQADKNQADSHNQAPQTDASGFYLESYFMEELTKLPDAPAKMPQNAENTDGGKIVPLNPILPQKEPIRKVASVGIVKKNNYWWAAAASLAVVAGASLWLYQLYQPNKTQQQPIVQTQITTPIIDTLKKNDAPTLEKPLVNQPKTPPQYSPEKKEKTEIAQQNNELKATEIPKTPVETQVEKDAVLAVIENVASKEAEQIVQPTKGTSTNALSREDQALLTALEAIAANKPAVAVEVLQGRNDEKARYYRALALLLTDKKKGKQALETLANDGDLETYFRNKIKDLLKKIN